MAKEDSTKKRKVASRSANTSGSRPSKSSSRKSSKASGGAEQGGRTNSLINSFVSILATLEHGTITLSGAVAHPPDGSGQLAGSQLRALRENHAQPMAAPQLRPAVASGPPRLGGAEDEFPFTKRNDRVVCSGAVRKHMKDNKICSFFNMSTCSPPAGQTCNYIHKCGKPGCTANHAAKDHHCRVAA